MRWWRKGENKHNIESGNDEMMEEKWGGRKEHKKSKREWRDGKVEWDTKDGDEVEEMVRLIRNTKDGNDDGKTVR